MDGPETNDIVADLRFYSRIWGDEPSIAPHPGTSPGFTTGTVIRHANQAADEIERLRAHVAELEAGK